MIANSVTGWSRPCPVVSSRFRPVTARRGRTSEFYGAAGSSIPDVMASPPMIVASSGLGVLSGCPVPSPMRTRVTRRNQLGLMTTAVP